MRRAVVVAAALLTSLTPTSGPAPQAPSTACADWRLVQQDEYSRLADLPRLGLSSGESICWGGHWCGAGDKLDLAQFVAMNASTVRALMATPDKKPSANASGPTTHANTTSLIVLDIEHPLSFSTMGEMSDTLLASVVAAVRLRIRTARSLFPKSTVALYNQRMRTNSSAALEGYRRASRLGLYDDVSHLIPVLYLKGDGSSAVEEVEAQLRAAATITNSTGGHIPLAPFLSWLYFGSSGAERYCAVSNSDARAVTAVIERLSRELPPQPRPIPIVHLWSGSDTWRPRGSLGKNCTGWRATCAEDEWLEKTEIVPKRCRPLKSDEPLTVWVDPALRRSADAAFAFDVRDDGAMVVSVGGAEFRLASTFSEAGGGSNALGGGGTGPSWSVAVHRNTDGSVEVLGRGSLYTIRRVVTRRQHRLLVNDTVSVHAPQAQGVACAHTATLPRSR